MKFTARPFYTPDSVALKHLPECPRVLRDGRLGWIGIQHGVDSRVGSMNILDLDLMRNTSHALPGRPGFYVETTTPGVVLMGLDRRLVLFDLNRAELTETGITVTADERVLINDGVAVPGGVIFGTKHLEFNQPIASLYYFDSATGQVREITGGQYCSNGKFFHDGSLIDVDSIPSTITCYKLDASMGAVDQSLVIPPASLPCFPDGLRPTPTGASVVVAFYNPKQEPDGVAWDINIADGAILNEWVLPGSPRVTCPELVMVDGSVKLIFTSAVEGMTPEIRAQAPQAGAMFIADTPFTAVPEPPPLVSV